MNLQYIVFTCQGQVKNYSEFLLLFLLLLGKVQKVTLGVIWVQNFINRKLDDFEKNGGLFYELF